MLGNILGSLASGAAGSAIAGMNKAPSAQQLPNQGPAAANAFGDINQLNNPYSAMQPLEMQQLMAMMNNPDIAKLLGGASRAGQASTRSGNMLMGEANQLYQQAYDPQSALKAQMQAQVQDQSNVQNAMYGLQSSPYGAGVANQNLSNFDINWQNQQLGREAQANPLIGQDLGAAVQAYMGGGQLPYGAYNQVTGDMTNAINQYMSQAGQGNAMTQNQIGDWLQYLGMGQSGVGVNQNAYGMNQNTAANAAAGLTPAFDYGFGQLFSGGGTGGGGGSPQPIDLSQNQQIGQPIAPINYNP